jgi:adenylate kinase
MFRAAIAEGSELGRMVEPILASGELVPDELTIALIRDRLSKDDAARGFVLDGFPRTVIQAQELQRMLHARQVMLDAVVNYELPLATIVDRLAGRRVCPSCRAVYHLVSHPPRTPGHCDRCATALEQRADDQPGAIRTRMAAYQDTTGPLLAFYDRLGLLVTVPADGGPEEILARTLQAPVFRLSAERQARPARVPAAP